MLDQFTLFKEAMIILDHALYVYANFSFTLNVFQLRCRWRKQGILHRITFNVVFVSMRTSSNGLKHAMKSFFHVIFSTFSSFSSRLIV